MAIKTKGLGLRVWRFLKRLFIFLFFFHLFYLLILKWVNPPITLTQFSSLVTGEGLKRDYVDYSQMSNYAKIAVISSEDQLFPEHNGFDWKSIEKAMEHNEKNPKKIRGASTISQQVAKNVFLWQGRSWIRKGLETYFTFLIEIVWGKKRILEMYLNISEMGEGIYGIEAAARSYFKKPASSLTRTESAMIAACLRNPKKYTVKPLSKFVSSRYPWVLRQMNNLQSDEEVQALLH
jgi:monofunctional biosynthetic peptidoglycan transglycosylase